VYLSVTSPSAPVPVSGLATESTEEDAGRLTEFKVVTLIQRINIKRDEAIKMLRENGYDGQRCWESVFYRR